jgi:hypothetical protein
LPIPLSSLPHPSASLSAKSRVPDNTKEAGASQIGVNHHTLLRWFSDKQNPKRVSWRPRGIPSPTARREQRKTQAPPTARRALWKGSCHCGILGLVAVDDSASGRRHGERRSRIGTSCLTCLLPDDLARALVLPDAEKHRLTQPIIPSPLRELYLTNHRRFNPNTTLHFGDG